MRTTSRRLVVTRTPVGGGRVNATTVDATAEGPQTIAHWAGVSEAALETWVETGETTALVREHDPFVGLSQGHR